MHNPSNHFQYQEGKPIKVGSQTLTVISKALVIPFPGVESGLVWNRGAAVRVATAGAGEVELPIIDHTRRWEVFFVVMALVGILSAILFSKRP